LTNLIIRQAGWDEGVLPFSLILLGVVIWLWDWLSVGIGGSTPPSDDSDKPALPTRAAHAALPAAEVHTPALSEGVAVDNFPEEDYHYRMTGGDIGEMTDEFPAVVLPPEEAVDAAGSPAADESVRAGVVDAAPAASDSVSSDAGASSGAVAAAPAVSDKVSEKSVEPEAVNVAHVGDALVAGAGASPKAEADEPAKRGSAGEALVAGAASGAGVAQSSVVETAAVGASGNAASSAVSAPAAVEEAPAAPVSRAAHSAAQPDDLTVVEGIGPKMNAALNAAGIHTFAQLANTDVASIHAAIEAAGMRFAPSVPTWAEQAAFAAKGDWDGLKVFQDTLTAGRRK
jgi:predicted flap endonuclease-1-like 5' DNA nuclease